MQIQLNQATLEAAVKQYIEKMGIAQPVKEIAFTVARKGGTAVSAEVTVADFVVTSPDAATAPVREEEPAPYKPSNTTTKEQPVAEAFEADEAEEDETEAAGTVTEAEPTKSLFG